MKKQLFIAFCFATCVSSVVFAPIDLGRKREQQPAAKPQGGASTITTAAGLVAAFPGSEADILAAAAEFATSNGGSGGNADSDAGKATTALLTNGSVTINASGTKSNKLGRLGK